MRINIPESVQAVIDVIRSAGVRVHLVGGAVVDVIRGQDPKDWDLEVHGLDMESLGSILSPFDPSEVGKAFGIFKINVGGLDVDVSIPRRDNKIGKGHKG